MNEISYAELGTVTVTFNPDVSLLLAQLMALPADSCKVVVDNNSSEDVIEEIKASIETLENVILLCSDVNAGLAAALNRGVAALGKFAPHAKLVLLLDQDSEPLPQSIETLVRRYRQLESKEGMVGCVGPTLIDPITKLSHGFHQRTRWRWVRVYPSSSSDELVKCININGSGTLTSIDLYTRLRGMDESLFIDHIDTDWSFRVQASGYHLWGVPNAVFVHRMGVIGTRFWFFGWHVWPLRSPKRHYFLFRNAILLMKRPYVPKIWKTWAVVKLAMTLLVTVIIGPDRWSQFNNMLKGMREGCRMQR